jgi:hypothetical protein
MRGDQLARQWRVIRAIEASTVVRTSSWRTPLHSFGQQNNSLFRSDFILQQTFSQIIILPVRLND